MIALLIAASYLVGSIPVAWLVARLVTGQDLWRMESGNLGVMNTALSVARRAGLLVFGLIMHSWQALLLGAVCFSYAPNAARPTITCPSDATGRA